MVAALDRHSGIRRAAGIAAKAGCKLGAPTPVAFFAYPDKPSMLVDEGCGCVQPAGACHHGGRGRDDRPQAEHGVEARRVDTAEALTAAQEASYARPGAFLIEAMIG
ncbi:MULTISPECIES: hypothetical protein [unclassified Achromobacter]|uniref:hypothetical protein n=1 Tax=unclassified Achromobacter TaxID=2626865 RepID=UPI001178BA15|nr:MULTISPECIES: hypothetical protein [unclassified Achromobacter]